MALQRQKTLAPVVQTLARPSYLVLQARALSTCESSKPSRSILRPVQRSRGCSSKQHRIANFSSQRCSQHPIMYRIPATRSQVRYKSSWEPERSRIYGWGWRLKSSWHHPGCKWVKSEGLLDDKAPRDQHCPACQEEQRQPLELSRRELLWQRRMEAMRTFIERDPYEALFGRSNRLLRGNLQPKSASDTPGFPWWSRKGSDHSSDITRTIVPDSRAGRTLNESSCGTEGEHKNNVLPLGSGKFNGSLQEQTSSVASQPFYQPPMAQRTENVTGNHRTLQKEDFRYDPISMRMVPKSTTSPMLSTNAQTELEQHEAVSIPVKKFMSDTSAARQAIKERPKSKTQHFSSSQEIMKKRERDLRSRHDWLLREGFRLENMLTTNNNVPPNLLQRANFRMNTLDTCASELSLSSLSIWQALRSTKHLSTEDQIDNLSRSIQEVSRSLCSVKRHLGTASWKISMRGANEWKTLKRNSLLTAEVKTSDVGLGERSSLGNKIQTDPVTNENSQGKHRNSSLTTQGLNVIQSSPHQVQSTWLSGENYVAPLEKGKVITLGKAWKDKVQDKVLKFPLVEKEKPLAQMSLAEIEKHRERLLDSWDKKHNKDSSADAASRRLASEIKAQKAAMAAYEARHSVHRTYPSAASIEIRGNALKPGKSVKDENYPKPISPEQEKHYDPSMPEEGRSISEKAFDIVDLEHQQVQPQQTSSSAITNEALNTKVFLGASSVTPSSTQVNENQNSIAAHYYPHDPALYLVLAYDPSKQAIYTASASGSFTPPTGERILSVSDSLARLHAPAKFIPLLAQHQANGYDIVSASKHLLVFKRMRPGPMITSVSLGHEDMNAQNVSQQPPEQQVGNFASPTGFVNHDSPFGSARLSASSSVSSTNPVIRKEEPVFSGNMRATGTQDWLDTKSARRRLRERHRNSGDKKGRGRFWRGLRRVLLIGGWTAACCYAMGVVMEYFRTGGKTEREEMGWDGIEGRRRPRSQIK